jgi:hypothetical protein
MANSNELGCSPADHRSFVLLLSAWPTIRSPIDYPAFATNLINVAVQGGVCFGKWSDLVSATGLATLDMVIESIFIGGQPYGPDRDA